MPYNINDLMNREAERERQRRPQVQPAQTKEMAPKAETPKASKVKVKKPKAKKQPVDLTPLQQKTFDYASVFLTVLLGGLLLAGAIRLVMWMFSI